jgi:hypothetical protein
MNATSGEVAGKAVGFDNKALLAEMKAWWDEQVGKDDPFASPKPPPGTIMDVLPEVDSLATVTALIVMEKYLPCEVPPSVIRPGGYHSFEDMTQDMLPKLHGLVAKHAAKQRENTKLKKETA